MIDCIAVNYRTNDDLKEFIESFRQFAPEEANLIVVDVDPITPYGWKDVPGVYIAMPQNIGFNRACNMAAANAKGDILALFNADIVLEENTIQSCAGALRDNPDWGILGPLQYNESGKVTHAGIFGTYRAPKHRAWMGRADDSVRDIQEAVSVSGSAYFIKRQTWTDLTSCSVYQDCFPGADGAFLPVQHYYGETGCSYHAWAHGYKVMYYGQAHCVHKWHKASPVGKIERETMSTDQALFRKFCDEHNIPRD